MSPGTKTFLQRWAINTLAVLVADYLISGISSDSTVRLVIAALVLGILNSILRPILLFLSIPLLIVTLGLFMLVINALLLYMVGGLVPGFHVASFGSAFLGSLVISIISIFINLFTGTKSEPPKTNPPKSDGGGPVIDV